MRLRWWVLIATVIAVGSLGGLYYLVTTVWPNPNTLFARPQLIFFGLLFLAFSTATVPLSAYFNHRFARPGWLARDKTRLVRQGAWMGLLVVLLAYFQLIRALNWTIGLVLAAVFILSEAFVITRG